MNLSLKGLRVLLTGASRGIGKATLTELVESGANVVAHCRKGEAELKEYLATHADSHVISSDLSQRSEYTSLVQQSVEVLGGLDILINNAGIAISTDPDSSTEHWLENWDKTIEVNLTAASFLCKEAISVFLRQNSGGRIINIASRASFRGDTPDYMAYAASKGGLVSLTRTIARHYGKNDIKAFTIAPGFVETDMANDFIEKYGREFVSNDIALKNLTQAKDIAPTILFLSSGKADHATGTTIDINAGSYVH